MKQEKRIGKQIMSASTEERFEAYCEEAGIEFFKLDGAGSEELRKEYLGNPKGKCPDYLCKKGSKEIVVEIKTSTTVGSEKRQELMEETGCSGVFNLAEESLATIEAQIRDASKKFKNMKRPLPGVVVLAGASVDYWCLLEILLGCQESFTRKETSAGEEWSSGISKTKRGIWDMTGTSISAVAFEAREGCWEGFGNPRGKCPLDEEAFSMFFRPEAKAQ